MKQLLCICAMIAMATLLAGCGSSEEMEVRPESTGNPTPAKGLDEPVSFKDAKLEGAVRTALEKPEGAVTGKEVASLVELVAEDLGVMDLSGLEHATNLTKLYLAGNQVADLTPLAGLTDLKYLNLVDNRFTDVTPLAKLTNLRDLWLVGNEISDDQQAMLKTALPRCKIKFWFGEF